MAAIRLVEARIDRLPLTPHVITDHAAWMRPRWRIVLALAIALILHVALLLVLREWLRGRFERPDTTSFEPMQLRLIELTPEPPSLAPSQREPTSESVQPQPIVRPSSPPIASAAAAKPEPLLEQPTADVPPDETATASVNPSTALAIAPADTFAVETPTRLRAHASGQPRLVAPDGRVWLPETDLAAQQAATRFPITPAKAPPGSSDPFSHRSPIPYVATRFDRAWVPDGETLIDTLLRKASKKSSTQIAGLQIDCQWVLIIAGCSWGSAKRVSIEELKRMRADVPMPRGPRTQLGS